MQFYILTVELKNGYKVTAIYHPRIDANKATFEQEVKDQVAEAFDDIVSIKFEKDEGNEFVRANPNYEIFRNTVLKDYAKYN